MSTARPAQAHTVAERVLQCVFDVLHIAATEAGGFIFRGRVDAADITELPAINLRRGVGLSEPYGHGADVCTVEFEVDHLVASDAWETAADALHAEVHAALAGDAGLARLCRGLRCIRTDLRAQSADVTRGTLTATYQVKAAHRVADLTATL